MVYEKSKMATSTDDVALVLGASQYQLRVFNLSGEKVCEKAHSKVTKAFQVAKMEESPTYISCMDTRLM